MSEHAFSNKVHIDFILILLIFSLCLFGLVILYSASGQNIDLVYSQAVKLLIALSGNKRRKPPTQDDIGILLNADIRCVFIFAKTLNGRYQSG